VVISGAHAFIDLEGQRDPGDGDRRAPRLMPRSGPRSCFVPCDQRNHATLSPGVGSDAFDRTIDLP